MRVNYREKTERERAYNNGRKRKVKAARGAIHKWMQRQKCCTSPLSSRVNEHTDP